MRGDFSAGADVRKTEGGYPSANAPLQAAPRFAFDYRTQDHQDLPHVVKFSGGRSSGMLLLVLLENGVLKADRGPIHRGEIATGREVDQDWRRP